MGDIYIGDNNNIAREAEKIYIGDSSGIASEIQKIYVGDENGIAREVYSAAPPLGNALPRAWIKAYQNSITEEDFSPSDPRIMGGSFIKDIQYTVVNGERRYTKIKVGYTFSRDWCSYMQSIGYSGTWGVRYKVKPVSTSQTYHAKVYYGGTQANTDINDNSYLNYDDYRFTYSSVPTEQYVEVTPYSGDYFVIPSGGSIELYIDTPAGT